MCNTIPNSGNSKALKADPVAKGSPVYLKTKQKKLLFSLLMHVYPNTSFCGQQVGATVPPKSSEVVLHVNGKDVPRGQSYEPELDTTLSNQKVSLVPEQGTWGSMPRKISVVGTITDRALLLSIPKNRIAVNVGAPACHNQTSIFLTPGDSLDPRLLV